MWPCGHLICYLSSEICGMEYCERKSSTILFPVSCVHQDNTNKSLKNIYPEFEARPTFCGLKNVFVILSLSLTIDRERHSNRTSVERLCHFTHSLPLLFYPLPFPPFAYVIFDLESLNGFVTSSLRFGLMMKFTHSYGTHSMNPWKWKELDRLQIRFIELRGYLYQLHDKERRMWRYIWTWIKRRTSNHRLEYHWWGLLFVNLSLYCANSSNCSWTFLSCCSLLYFSCSTCWAPKSNSQTSMRSTLSVKFFLSPFSITSNTTSTFFHLNCRITYQFDLHIPLIFCYL